MRGFPRRLVKLFSSPLAELLGGQLTLVRTEPGDGSHFRLSLPIGLVPENNLPDEKNIAEPDSLPPHCDPTSPEPVQTMKPTSQDQPQP